MQIVILSALGNVTASRCLQSLLSTTASECFDLHLFRERQFREHTLNAAKEMVGSDDDVLFVGDDIEFTPGWYEALMKYYEHADILGMSMLYPNSSKAQDRGYDMLRIDDHITWSARDRGVNKDRIDPFGIRPCDAVCGCFLFVKSSVLQLVPKFREQGKNCLGELIFMCEARKKGASIAVTDHFLYHDGISTKSNPDQELSSISYLKERDLLQSIVSDFADETWVRYELRSALSPELKKILSHSSGQILIYGIGTVTEGILNMLDLRDQEVSFCSGLPTAERLSPVHLAAVVVGHHAGVGDEARRPGVLDPHAGSREHERMLVHGARIAKMRVVERGAEPSDLEKRGAEDRACR